MRLIVTVFLLAALFSLSPHRRTIPPAIESDYCYQLIAADRLVDGKGLTSLQPVAPLQPWEWRYDWGFLTQWPAGYPLLVAGIRRLTGLSTIAACQWINLVACAFALVGWFAYVRHSTPGVVSGYMLALVAAGSAVSMNALTNPGTDLLVTAALPWILLLVAHSMTKPTGPRDSLQARERRRWNTSRALCIAGALSGSLFWFRYAAIFVPTGIAAFLLIRTIARRCRRTLGFTVIYIACAAVPIISLFITNRALGPSSSASEQLNLGAKLSFAPTYSLFSTAWQRFTDLGFYDYHRWMPRLTALAPLAIILSVLACPSWRRQVAQSLRRAHWSLGACIALAGLFMLISATAIFGSKYHYVGLDRYYEPFRPLYFLIFLAPLAGLRSRLVRSGVCVAAFVGCSWIVQQEWLRTYQRWSSAHRETTAYGQWATCFSPGARAVYQWLCSNASPDLIVVSNFHEYVALETGWPALPVPKDRATLDRWIADIAMTRDLREAPRVVFVLDSSPRWRDYWIPPTAEIVDRLRIGPPAVTFGAATIYFDREPHDARLASHDEGNSQQSESFEQPVR